MKKKSQRKDIGKGFIPRIVGGSRKLYHNLWSLTEDIDFGIDENGEIRRHHHEFIVHIYQSTTSLRYNDLKLDGDLLFIPIQGTLIDAEISRDVNYKILEKAGLIEYKSPHHTRKKSRRYKLVDDIWNELRRVEDHHTKTHWQSLVRGEPKEYILVNLRNGETVRTICGHRLEYQDADFKTPPLVKNSIKAISDCVFDPKYMGILANQLGQAVRVSSERLKFLENKPRYRNNPDKTFDDLVDAREEHRRLKCKYNSYRTSQAAILRQKPVLLNQLSNKGNFLYTYKAPYEPQISGRLTERGGGLQNASRIFKHLAFRDVESVYNYDLKASQANILIQEFEACTVNAAWIKNYLTDNNAKKTFADIIGSDTPTWKQCLYSTLMGADCEITNGAVFKALRNYFGDYKKTVVAHKKFLECAKDLIGSTERWREAIYGSSHYTYSSRRGYTHWKNAAGMRHKVYGIDRNDQLVLMESVYQNQVNPDFEMKAVTNKITIAKLKRQLAAFVLQGRECCFIHHLTLLCSSEEIKVYRNEHDGIITDKIIPEDLIIEAGKRSGLQNPVLEEKELASKDDIKKMRELLKKYLD